jgi:hypothetical protein
MESHRMRLCLAILVLCGLLAVVYCKPPSEGSGPENENSASSVVVIKEGSQSESLDFIRNEAENVSFLLLIY